ncbi:MAG: CAP domain-containing protein [Candidatus Lernaella stagnicola]|nr:CAP domain-containing protein [Candidatus Lernaella stagnicola]
MKRVFVFVAILGCAAFFLILVGCEELFEEEGETSGAALVDLVNDYRADHGLPRIPKSPALMTTAKAHVRDLVDHDPVHGDCNLHSWSEKGDWTKCCYTDDHANAACMHSKPAEIAGYPGEGYEIAASSSAGIDAEGALDQWKGSSGHDAVIRNKDTWADNDWQAIGAAIKDEYAVVWFGEEPDPDLED